MQMNNAPLRGIRSIRAILVAALFFLVGGFFVGLGIYLLINPSASESGQSSPFVFVAIGAGAAVMVIAVIGIIIAVKNMKRNSKPLTEEQVQENERKLREGAPEIANLVDAKLYFHRGGKLNQSFLVENKEGKVVYECHLKRFNPIGADLFEFKDIEHDYVKEIKATKCVTSSADGGLPFVGDALTSRFKINGTMCWDYLHNLGYDIGFHILERNIARYELKRLGKVVAEILPCSHKDPFNEENKNFLMMGQGYYRIEIIDARLEDAVMAAFIVSRTEMVE